MVDLVEKQDGSIITVHNPHKITRDKTERVIMSQPQDKQYKIVYNKRVIQPDFDTLPYAYWHMYKIEHPMWDGITFCNERRHVDSYVVASLHG